MQQPPAEVLAELSAQLTLSADEALALLTDPTRAPALMDGIIQRFALETDDEAEPFGLQLYLLGVLSECAAFYFDGVKP